MCPTQPREPSNRVRRVIERPGFDSLILAADRRTLFVELQENPGHLDQVRVLIEAEK